ncbi:lysophospholipid acyltransferase family protein [Kaarinaea lacus]
MNKKSFHPFKLYGTASITKLYKIDSAIESFVEKCLGLKSLNDMYQDLPVMQDEQDFLQQALDRLNITYQYSQNGLSHIPKQGPSIIAANHPFGAIEGIIMAHLLRQRRSDIKIMANYFLRRVPEISDLFIPVDPFGGKNSTAKNIKPLRQAIQWVKQGGLLLIFPAGEVAHRTWQNREVTDPPWSKTIAHMVNITQASVTPVYFPGSNSLLFQHAGLIHPRLRTAMLPRELLNKQGTALEVRIGKTIPYHKLKACGNESELLQYLRVRTYMLKNASIQDRKKPDTIKPSGQSSTFETVRQPISTALLGAEIETLNDIQCLAQSGDLQVYYASAKQIPWVLQEIGRLREITFRDTGEGTGKSTDIDIYDDYYQHLFIWNLEKQEIVGAYRMGLTDQILPHIGIKGLYTQTLFKYKRQLVSSINPAIELGRSFVRREYQKNFTPLMLLWKGICQFMVKNPQYRILFGPVSISNDYETISQQLLVDFLRANNFHAQLARFVKPRNPFRHSKKRPLSADDFSLVNNIEQISDIVAQLEKDDKGLPILLKQYLKLGGTLLGFNVDQDFNNALDGLIMVDMVKADLKVLQKYMGTEQAAKFLEYHQQSLNLAS